MTGRWLNDLVSDIRFVSRSFSRSPLFYLIAIATIALGIGANIAVFGLAQEVLIEKLPVHRPDQLVELDCIDQTNPEEGQCDASWPGFHMYEQNADLLSGLFAYSSIPDLNVIHEGRSQLASALLASGSIYEVLGVRPLHGRLLNPGDDEKGAPAVAVLGYSFWRDHLASDLDIVGRAIRINDHLVTVVGVTPPDFRGVTLGEPPDITLPIGSTTDLFLRPGSLENGTNWWLRIIGRRKEGVSVEQAEASLRPVFQQTVEHMIASAGTEDGPRFRDILRNYVFRIRPAADGGFSELRSDLAGPLRVLARLVGFVLVIACANLAGLFLSRAAARRHEMAIRYSLGAGRLRLARQSWTESLLVSAIGGAIGLYIADWAAPLLLRMAAGEGALRAMDLRPDPGILIFTIVIVVLTGILIGTGPVLGLSIAPAEAIRASRSGEKTSPLARFLVPAQVTLATLLLVGAGLFVRTLNNIRDLDLGYREAGVMTLTTSPDLAGYDEVRRTAYWNELTARLGALPGVESVTLSADPIGTLNVTTSVRVPRFESAVPRERSTGIKRVGIHFAETAGLTLVRGRDFAAPDANVPQRVAIVNESFAQHFFRTVDVVGREFFFNFGATTDPWTIIGVVRDARDRHPKSAPERVVYALTPLRFFGSAAVGIRMSESASLMPGTVRAVAAQIDATVPIREIQTLEEQLVETLGRDRLLATLGTFFGGLALILAAIGLYGLLSGNVVRRTREIGVRVAVGASRREIVRLVLVEGMKLTAIGVAGGLAAGLLLARYVASQFQLVEIPPNDPVTLTVASVILVAVAFFASLLPALRAARINPVVALNRE